jgi:transposase InsO family protein
MKMNQEEFKVLRRKGMIELYENVSKNVTDVCNTYGVSRSVFYYWYKRYKEKGVEGLIDLPVGPHSVSHKTPRHIEDLIISIRLEKHYGALRISWYLQRHHNIYVSSTAINNILKRRGIKLIKKKWMPRISKANDNNLLSPGDKMQLDVKFLKRLGKERKRFFQFTAIDECTRYRVLKIYGTNSEKSAIDFIEEVRKKIPFAIKLIQTDNGSEFGTQFTWHINELGMTHKRNNPGCPEENGKVERSHRTDQEEFYSLNKFRDEADLKNKLEKWEDEYNNDRPHMGLKGLTPGEKLNKIMSTNKEGKSVQKKP